MDTKRRLAGTLSAMMACAWVGAVEAVAQKAQPAPRSIALPGAPPAGGVVMDFIAYDRAHGRVWVPAGNTGSVDVIDVATDKVTRIEGFATKEVERDGRKRTLGPSSVAIEDGAVLVVAPVR
jgi:DNA-binding beta-propeller fold protein YncE